MSVGDKTKFFKPIGENDTKASLILREVYEAMKDKGHDPVVQIVGYLLSGDPTYITSHKNARNIIRGIDTYDLLEELVTFYVENKEI